MTKLSNTAKIQDVLIKLEMCRIDFLSQFIFEKNSDSVWNEFGSVQFEKCSSVWILQLFTTYVIVEWLIYSKYYNISDMLNELCISYFDTVVNKR